MIKIILLMGIAVILLYKWDLDDMLILIGKIKIKLLDLWIRILAGKK